MTALVAACVWCRWWTRDLDAARCVWCHSVLVKRDRPPGPEPPRPAVWGETSEAE